MAEVERLTIKTYPFDTNMPTGQNFRLDIKIVCGKVVLGNDRSYKVNNFWDAVYSTGSTPLT
jgi:hypothetical protein